MSISWNVPTDTETEISPAGEAVDPERSMREAARRAASLMRRYATANRCDRLWTLTYAPEHLPADFGEVWERDAGRFRERLWAAVGERFPVVMVPERGSESGRLHLHLLTNRFLRQELVAEAWGLGFVDARRIKSRQVVTPDGEVTVRAAGGRERSRAAAGYLTSYLKKGMVEGHEFGRHRYSTTRGFGSRSRAYRFSSMRAARAWCSLTVRGEVVHEWSSSESPAWVGPPVLVRFYEDDPEGLSMGGGP